MQTIFSLSTFSIFPASFTITTYLCTQEPCQSSCRQSGRHGALSPLRENNQADRCTPGCNRRRAGPDPPRRHWLGFEAACRSELGEQAEGRHVSAQTYTTKPDHAYKLRHQRTFMQKRQRPTNVHKQLQAEGLMRNYWRGEEWGNEVKMKGDTKLSLTIC